MLVLFNQLTLLIILTGFDNILTENANNLTDFRIILTGFGNNLTDNLTDLTEI